MYVKTLLKTLVYMLVWFNYSVMDVVNVLVFYLAIISGNTNDFLPGDDKGL